MMEFNFQISARKVIENKRKKLLRNAFFFYFIVVIMTLALLSKVNIDYGLYYKGNKQWLPALLSALICLVSIMILRDYYSTISKDLNWYSLVKNCGECWNIKITDTEIIWDSPSFAEKKFHIKLRNILKVCKTVTDTGMGIAANGTTYLIETNSGEVIDLNYSLSGINIDLFIKTLIGLDIKYDYRTKEIT